MANIRRIEWILASAVCAAAVSAALLHVPATAVQPPRADPDRYIVVLDEGAADPDAIARQHSARYGVQVGFVYRHALRGYSAVIPANRVSAVRSDRSVAYLEVDQKMSVVAQTLPWGVDKIDADTSSTKAGDGIGSVSNVNTYVIDTGIDATHSDLNVVKHVNFASGPNRDCHGHGTHVAGTVAAKDNTQDVVGVVPGAPLTGIKVLSCSGSGSVSGVIKGVDWVTKNATKPAMANMSLGGGASAALDDAVKSSADSGVFYAVAAGNSGADACNYSPARAGTYDGVTTVAATDSNDTETSWSNFGKCVDIWAPGASILSTDKGGGTSTMSGTSMASPHVGGGGALYLSNNVLHRPALVETALKNAATTVTTSSSKDGRTIIRAHVGGF